MIHRFCRILAASVFIVATTAHAINDPAWPTYQGNAEHTGYIDREIGTQPPTVRWQMTPQPSAVKGIAIGDGKVFTTVVTGNSALVAHDLASGAESWRRQFDNVFSVNPPAYDADSGSIVLATGNHSDTHLRSYAADTGAFNWRSAFQAQSETYLSPTLSGGAAYINGGYFGGMYV